MKPYRCKIHGATEPYVRPRKGMVPLRTCRICNADRSRKFLATPKSKSYHAERYIQRRTEARARGKAYARGLKIAIVAGYGGVCECCGETAFEFLSIDHINGGGSKARKGTSDAGSGLYRRLIREGFPRDEYRLLCMNCNFAFGRYGYCPHQTASVAAAE